MISVVRNNLNIVTRDTYCPILWPALPIIVTNVTSCPSLWPALPIIVTNATSVTHHYHECYSPLSISMQIITSTEEALSDKNLWTQFIIQSRTSYHCNDLYDICFCYQCYTINSINQFTQDYLWATDALGTITEKFGLIRIIIIKLLLKHHWNTL